MKLEKIEAVIFDMDGVIVDSEDRYTELEQQLFRSLGLNIPDEEHRSYQGSSNKLMWQRISQRHRLPNDIDTLVEMTNQAALQYFQNISHLEPMSGIRELLLHLNQCGLKLALASSSTLPIIREVLTKTGLASFFEVVVDSEMAGAGKPDPAIFTLAAQNLGVLPKNCLVVEDSTNGIRAARLARMRCVAFNGPGAEHQNQQEADVIINNLLLLKEMFRV